MGVFALLSIIFLMAECSHAYYVKDDGGMRISDCNRIEWHLVNASTLNSYIVKKAFGSEIVWKTKIELIRRPKFVRECCAGFEMISEKCMPICKDDCIHGDCVSPGRCLCHEGWEGYQCTKAICKDDCIHGDCVSPGRCLCHEGWEGYQCTKECDDTRYGKNCYGYCECQNSGICNKVNGSCLCPPGFAGLFCESPCPKGSFGDNCDNMCHCRNGATCDPIQGKCLCPPGYIGQFCEKKCPDFTYGKDCSSKCTCDKKNTEFCNHINGVCNCHSGYIGKVCEEKCPLNTWGPRCERDCNCGINNPCNHISGNCICLLGLNGTHCNETVGDHIKPAKLTFIMVLGCILVLSLLITSMIYCVHSIFFFKLHGAPLLFEPLRVIVNFRDNSQEFDVEGHSNAVYSDHSNAVYSDTTEAVTNSSIFPIISLSSLASDVGERNDQHVTTNNYGYNPMFGINVAAQNPRSLFGVRYSTARTESGYYEDNASLCTISSSDVGPMPVDEIIYVEPMPVDEIIYVEPMPVNEIIYVEPMPVDEIIYVEPFPEEVHHYDQPRIHF